MYLNLSQRFAYSHKLIKKALQDAGRKVWLIMIPGNDAVRKMLALSDAELIETIKELCMKNGINTSSVNIGPKEMAILRTVLKNAKEEDIARMMSAFGAKGGAKS